MLASSVSTPAATDDVELAGGSARAVITIVVADAAGAAERTAAEELAHYLEQATGVPARIVGESDDEQDGAAILVGPTRFATQRFGDATRLAGEEWRIVVARGRLLIFGGRPRGTLYAAYRFLEQYVGVRWWTPWDESVPTRPVLRVAGTTDERGRPAFVYRDIYGIGGPPRFAARNRINGHFTELTADYGGRESYGPPHHVHSLFDYVPPDEFFDTHPEYFSKVDGRRRAKRAQLCLTNDAVRAIVAERLARNIASSRAEAERNGEAPPRLFGISQNDWGGPCECDTCRALTRREGASSATVVEFINALADGIALRYPDVLIDTLAYYYSLKPPKTLAFRDNVTVRVAALQSRDFARPVTSSRNRSIRRVLAGWKTRTKHLRVWDYGVTYGESANLPLPNLPIIASDLRYYVREGVEGMFVQHDAAVRADMRDLKVWVLAKLLEDPTRSVDALVVDFTDGFYGPAGEPVRRYLAELARAARRRPASIRYPARPSQFRYLTPGFLRRGQALFDQAEASVAADRPWLTRVRRARLSLDRATLLLWSEALARKDRSGNPALVKETVAERYRRAATGLIDERVLPGHRAKARGRLEAEIAEH